MLAVGGTQLASPPSALATIGTNDYPSSLAPPVAMDSVVDPWGFYNRECTSFVAWRLNNDNGVAFSNNMTGPNGKAGHFGNASNWASNAAYIGYTVDNNKAPGAVAYWAANADGGYAGPYGHVAYVYKVESNGSIDTEDYNSGDTGNYATHNYPTTSPDWPTSFIHIGSSSSGSWGGIGSSPTFLGTDTVSSGQQIGANQYIESADGRFALLLQSDGNVVLYNNGAIWSTGTSGTAATRFVMQTDGNLVLYTATNTPLWDSGTSGNGSSHLSLQDDGNLVLYRDSDEAVLWQSGTGGHPAPTAFGSDTLSVGQTLVSNQYLRSADKRYGLLLQTDGNLVLYGPGYHVLWSSGTPGSGATHLSMQTDGNLVLYTANNTPVWNSVTGGNGSSHLSLQDDGNLVLYRDSDSAVLWQSGTGGQI